MVVVDLLVLKYFSVDRVVLLFSTVDCEVFHTVVVLLLVFLDVDLPLPVLQKSIFENPIFFIF